MVDSAGDNPSPSSGFAEVDRCGPLHFERIIAML
jgi:hypothetical protein